MTRLFNLFFVLIGLVLVGFGLTMVKMNGDLRFAIVSAIGSGLIIWGFIRERRREKRIAEQRKKNIEQRTRELTGTPWKANDVLVVKGDSLIPLLSFGTLIGMAVTYFGVVAPNTPSAIFFIGIVFSFFSLVMLLRALSDIGKPLLEISPQGVRMSIHGFIAWSEIGGISLSVYSHRGITTYALAFQVENYRHAVKDIHWSERLLSWFGMGALRRGIVSVPLKNAGEEPETIHSVARFLWQQSTGRGHVWSPTLSADMNQALRRLDEFKAKRIRHFETLDAKMQENPESALQEIERFNKEMEQFRNDWNTVKAEQRRLSARAQWAAVIAIIGLIMALAWPLLKRYL